MQVTLVVRVAYGRDFIEGATDEELGDQFGTMVAALIHASGGRRTGRGNRRIPLVGAVLVPSGIEVRGRV